MLNRLIKKISPRSPVWWANFGMLSCQMDMAIPTASPPVLVISLPRSGSSWVAKALELAPNVLYLREPITQTCTKSPTHPVVFEFPHIYNSRSYRKACDMAFKGIPAFSDAIVSAPERWSLNSRTLQQLLIKEVNPLALEWLIEQYKPRIIYLLRHPAAVAHSYFCQGWTQLDRSKHFADQASLSPASTNLVDRSFWCLHGEFQAQVLQRSLKHLEQYENSIIVQYEDLCRDPKAQFYKLFEFCQLSWSQEISDGIQKLSTSNNPYEVGQYNLERNSSEMVVRWRDTVSSDQIREVKTAFLRFKLPYYRPENW